MRMSAKHQDIYMNQLLPKFEVAAICATDNPDIVCLVETWLCSDVLDNYSTVRLDRNRHGWGGGGGGGGVAMYIHDSVAYNVLLSGSADLELLVSLSRNIFQLCLSVFYRPPSSPSSIFDTLCETLLSVPHSYFSNFVILGDFN